METPEPEKRLQTADEPGTTNEEVTITNPALNPKITGSSIGTTGDTNSK
ncbi:unnamed protein product, partial [Rotaria sp. Silwood1]